MSEVISFKELETPRSLEIIRNIAAVIWPETFKNILSQEQIAYMMEMMYAPSVMEDELARGYHFRAAYVDDVPAGYTSWSPYETPGKAKLHKVYLLSQFHGRGIGSQMIADVEDLTRRAGFSTLRLNVNKNNLRAMQAYERRGFRQVEAVKIDIGGGFFMDDFVMEKSLVL